MTDKAAADLKVALDAMRLARAEDAKLCARLAARVKELEAEFERLRSALTFDQELALGYAGSIADGTRDKTAARCKRCRVPIDLKSSISDELCGGCWNEVVNL